MLVAPSAYNSLVDDHSLPLPCLVKESDECRYTWNVTTKMVNEPATATSESEVFRNAVFLARNTDISRGYSELQASPVMAKLGQNASQGGQDD
jgi:hypothetical protein